MSRQQGSRQQGSHEQAGHQLATAEPASPSSQRRALDAAALRERLRAVGYADVEVVESTGSTNSDLGARQDAPNGTVLLAEEQTAGRGRMNRPWSAPARSQVITSISFTLPEIPAERLGLLPLLVGLSIGRGVREITGVPAELKWPNDVLVDGRKLVGILVEAPQVHGVPRVVVGFGLNYDLTREELPVPHATSLALETAASATPEDELRDNTVPALVSREDLIVGILLRLQEDLDRFRNLGGAPEAFLSRYKQLSATLGAHVRVKLPQEEILEGVAVDFAPGGELVVEKENTRHEVSAGDVIHVRPGDETKDY